MAALEIPNSVNIKHVVEIVSAFTRYFDDSGETPDEVIDRAYVTSDELTRYEGILETYLKDRTVNIGGSQLKTIETSRSSANLLTGEIQKFASSQIFSAACKLSWARLARARAHSSAGTIAT